MAEDEPGFPAPSPGPPIQGGWRSCINCRCLYYGPETHTGGICPAGGEHILSPSEGDNPHVYFDYALDFQ